MNILFVCTGNTCRSPMAAAIMDKLCKDDCLDVTVNSAGLLAKNGEPATYEAIEAVKKYDIDLSGHTSKQITQKLINESDIIIAMTDSHKMLLDTIAGEKTATISELSDINGEISDPYGGDLQEYIDTCDKLYIALSQIENNLMSLLDGNKNDE